MLLFAFGVCAGTSAIRGAVPDAVVAWGSNEFGQTNVPLQAQRGVTAIAAGKYHTVALKSDGSVVAWGGNATGLATVPLDAQSGVTAIAVGGYHIVALKNDGAVLTWDWSYDQSVTPIEARTGVIKIAAGENQIVALKNDGSVVAWDSNGSVQTNVPLTAKSGVKGIAVGFEHIVAVKNDGSVIAWGSNQFGQTTVLAGLSGVIAIAAGDYYSVALRSDGSVVAWGKMFDGINYQPVAVPADLREVSAIAAGGDHIVALKNDGTLVTWGKIYDGLHFLPATAPVDLKGVTAIAAGSFHDAAIVVPAAPAITSEPVSQTVAEWQPVSFTVISTGYPLNYQWSSNGVDIAGATSDTYLVPFARLSLTSSYSVVVKNILGSVTNASPALLTVKAASPGSVVAWGDNRWGQTTVPVAAQGAVIAIAAGGGHSLALKTDGSVVAWGANDTGQTTVPSAAQSEVVAIAAGNGHSLALKADGTVVAWGNNEQGQVTGAQTSDDFPEQGATATASPVKIGGKVLSGVKAIAAGANNTVVLMRDGSVAAWGGSSVIGGPTEVPAGLSGVTAISAGLCCGDYPSGHIIGLNSNGTVAAWGSNAYGEVTDVPSGNESYTSIADPVTLKGLVLSEVKAIAAGGIHSAALKNDGSVVEWGVLYTSQDDTLFPKGDLIAIAAGASHTVALTAQGTVVVRGRNCCGQIDVPAGLKGVTAIAAGGLHTMAIVGTAASLQAALRGKDLVLLKSANANGFALQSTFSLASPVTWIDSISPPAVDASQFTVTNIATRPTQFYRLIKL